MAKYAIEVDSVYAVTILAPLAELLDGSEEDDSLLGPYLRESLPYLLAILIEGDIEAWVASHPLDWEKIAKSAQQFADLIREKIAK